MSDAVRLPQTPVEAIAELYRRVRDLEMARLRPIPLILAAWPVGSIFIHTTATNPADLLGGGVWTRFGEGRMLLSQSGADADFDTALETGGTKTHTLSTAELPNHTHSLPNHVHTMAHTHTVDRRGTDTVTDHSHPYSGSRLAGASGATPLTDGTHTTSASSSADTGNPTTNPSSGGAGSGQAHNNMPPYIVVYMWRRTA